MTTQKTNFLEDEIVDHILGTGAWTAPTSVTLNLYSAASGEAGGGTELTGNGYVEQTVAFGASSGGVASNSGTETFTASGGAWLQILGQNILDQLNNILYYESLTGPTLADGDSYQFDPGDITVTET